MAYQDNVLGLQHDGTFCSMLITPHIIASSAQNSADTLQWTLYQDGQGRCSLNKRWVASPTLYHPLEEKTTKRRPQVHRHLDKYGSRSSQAAPNEMLILHAKRMNAWKRKILDWKCRNAGLPIRKPIDNSSIERAIIYIHKFIGIKKIFYGTSKFVVMLPIVLIAIISYTQSSATLSSNRSNFITSVKSSQQCLCWYEIFNYCAAEAYYSNVEGNQHLFLSTITEKFVGVPASKRQLIASFEFTTQSLSTTFRLWKIPRLSPTHNVKVAS